MCLSSLPVGADALAQSKKAAQGENSSSSQASAQRAYAAGTKSFEAGDMAAAEQQLSVALAGGGLPNAQMARALYLRGAAYRRLGRPAQAISDLTTAVWLKGGLSDADKAKATEERQLAYREAGLGDTPPPVGAAPLDQTPKAAATPPASGAQVVQVTEQSFWSNFSLPSLSGSNAQQPAPSTAGATPAQTSAQSSSFWSFFGGGSADAEQAAASPSTPAAAGPVAAGLGPDPGVSAAAQGQGSGTETAATPAPAWETHTAGSGSASAASAVPQAMAVSSYAPQPPPDTGINPMGFAADEPGTPSPAGTANPLAGTGTAVSNFFGNIFGSGSTAADASPAVTTGSTQPGGWSPDTTAVPSQTSSMIQRGPDSLPQAQSDALPWASAATPAAPAKVAAAAGGGKYKLQVAAVRSREEAEQLVRTLNAYQPVRNGVVSADIDEAVIGSMGTFYRVRLGPYANAKEPEQLCTTLKPQGFDCLVVTQ